MYVGLKVRETKQLEFQHSNPRNIANLTSVIRERDTPELTPAAHVLQLEEYVHTIPQKMPAFQALLCLLMKADNRLLTLIEQNLTECCRALNC